MHTDVTVPVLCKVSVVSVTWGVIIELLNVYNISHFHKSAEQKIEDF
jgi:hypothetical protein